MKTSLVLFALAFLLPVPAFSAGQNPPQTTKPRILADAGHGQWAFNPDHGSSISSRLVAYQDIVERFGAEIVTTKAPITSTTLAGSSVLALCMATHGFNEAEVAAIVDFVRGGGNLLLVADEERRASVPLAALRLNDILAPFGLELTPDTPAPHNCGAVAPAGPINAALREIPYSGGRAVKGGTAYAFILDGDGKPTDLAQAAFTTAPGGGRIIVMADGMPMLLFGGADGIRLSDTRDVSQFWGKDSRAFMADAIAWLLGEKSEGFVSIINPAVVSIE